MEYLVHWQTQTLTSWFCTWATPSLPLNLCLHLWHKSNIKMDSMHIIYIEREVLTALWFNLRWDWRGGHELAPWTPKGWLHYNNAVLQSVIYSCCQNVTYKLHVMSSRISHYQGEAWDQHSQWGLNVTLNLSVWNALILIMYTIYSTSSSCFFVCLFHPGFLSCWIDACIYSTCALYLYKWILILIMYTMPQARIFLRGIANVISYIALYPVNIYELAALYIINIKTL